MNEQNIIEKQVLQAEIAVLQREKNTLLEQCRVIHTRIESTDEAILTKFQKLEGMEKNRIANYLKKIKKSVNTL